VQVGTLNARPLEPLEVVLHHKVPMAQHGQDVQYTDGVVKDEGLEEGGGGVISTHGQPVVPVAALRKESRQSMWPHDHPYPSLLALPQNTYIGRQSHG